VTGPVTLQLGHAHSRAVVGALGLISRAELAVRAVAAADHVATPVFGDAAHLAFTRVGLLGGAGRVAGEALAAVVRAVPTVLAQAAQHFAAAPVGLGAADVLRVAVVQRVAVVNALGAVGAARLSAVAGAAFDEAAAAVGGLCCGCECVCVWWW